MWQLATWHMELRRDSIAEKSNNPIKCYGVNFRCTFILSKFSPVPFLLPSQHVADIVIYVSPEQESSCPLAKTSKSLPALSDHLSECPVQRMGHPATTSN